MSVRRHVITGEPVLFAPERASRPHAFTGEGAQAGRCPFCPGHEEDTPPEIARLADGARWLARVFPNKYPPVAGAEVIVEAPSHAAFHEIAHAADVVRLYVERYRAHGEPYVALFKNEGTMAGASIGHPHSQIVPLPFLPPRIEKEMAAFAGRCPLCRDVERPLVIRESEAFTWFAPSGSWMAYQQWIVPRRHVSEMSALADEEIVELANVLRQAAAATSRIAKAFNWTFMNFPGGQGHFYVDVLPRMTAIAGLELGTGTFVEIIDPGRAAASLRP